jgi:transposase InsO family protein
MKERGLRALQPKNFIPRTSDGRASRPSSDLLADQPAPSAINQAWAGDITHIPTSKGWRYLAVVIDLQSRRIIGWSLADHMRAEPSESDIFVRQCADETRVPQRGEGSEVWDRLQGHVF